MSRFEAKMKGASGRDMFSRGTEETPLNYTVTGRDTGIVITSHFNKDTNREEHAVYMTDGKKNLSFRRAGMIYAGADGRPVFEPDEGLKVVKS